MAEVINLSLFVLTISSVLAHPINMNAGLMGMNVAEITPNQPSYGFWIVVAITTSFTVIAAWFVFRTHRQ